jgi:hypothetical protein
MDVEATDKKTLCNKQFELNGEIKEFPESLPIIKGRILFPLTWLAKEMGADSVVWDGKSKTVTVEIPAYFKQHQYLSYLNGIKYGKESKEYPLPKRLQDLEILPYPLTSGNNAIFSQKPITLNITDKGFSMPWAVYDYEVVKGKLYVTSDWFNTMFLAHTNRVGNKIKINYPTRAEIQKKVADLEMLTQPTSPEEALALWIVGQQKRSGALQYSALSPELKQKFLAKKQGWVTGGSSPSAGRATIVNKEQVDDSTIRYVIHIDEMLQGNISGQITETIEVKKYELEGKTYWLIVGAKGDTGYYSILPEENN